MNHPIKTADKACRNVCESTISSYYQYERQPKIMCCLCSCHSPVRAGYKKIKISQPDKNNNAIIIMRSLDILINSLNKVKVTIYCDSQATQESKTIVSKAVMMSQSVVVEPKQKVKLCLDLDKEM